MNKIGWAIFLISLGYEWPLDADSVVLHRIDGSEVVELCRCEWDEGEKIIYRHGN